MHTSDRGKGGLCLRTSVGNLRNQVVRREDEKEQPTEVGKLGEVDAREVRNGHRGVVEVRKHEEKQEDCDEHEDTDPRELLDALVRVDLSVSVHSRMLAT